MARRGCPDRVQAAVQAAGFRRLCHWRRSSFVYWDDPLFLIQGVPCDLLLARAGLLEGRYALSQTASLNAGNGLTSEWGVNQRSGRLAHPRVS